MRFMISQVNDGSWPYSGRGSGSPAMTCVGLIGLGMGHGINANLAAGDKTVKADANDPTLQNGLTHLARNIGEPKQTEGFIAMQNLYFLWSVERVAMLYDLKTIGGKDWYGWGAQTLVHNQRGDGAWQGGGYHGSTPHLDTCLALLFLKRSNLVQDLTENLRLYMPIRDPH